MANFKSDFLQNAEVRKLKEALPICVYHNKDADGYMSAFNFVRNALNRTDESSHIVDAAISLLYGYSYEEDAIWMHTNAKKITFIDVTPPIAWLEKNAEAIEKGLLHITIYDHHQLAYDNIQKLSFSKHIIYQFDNSICGSMIYANCFGGYDWQKIYGNSKLQTYVNALDTGGITHHIDSYIANCLDAKMSMLETVNGIINTGVSGNVVELFLVSQFFYELIEYCKLEGTKYVDCSLEYDFRDAYDSIMEIAFNDTPFVELKNLFFNRVVSDFQKAIKLVESLTDNVKTNSDGLRIVCIGDSKPNYYVYTALKIILPEIDMYYQIDDKYRISMRTWNDKIDLAKFANKFGGGGHRKASGFQLKNATMSFKIFDDLKED